MRLLPRPATHLRRRHVKRTLREVESYLSGSYLDRARGGGDPPPSWCWLNVLAHGDLGGIQRVSVTSVPSGYGPAESAWRVARQLLACEVLSSIGEDEELLGRLQRAVLIPLEDRFISERASAPRTPSELVRSTRAALESCSY